HHLSRLVDDLLDVARITQGKIELRTQRVDLNTAVHRALDMMRLPILTRGHDIVVSLPCEPLWLQADPTRLEQIIINLLSNAIKSTDPGGRIWLTTERRADDAALRVRDTGAGLAPDMLPRVFELFTQADQSPARSQGGLGVGLTLVRALVEMHGGYVRAHS